MFVRLDILFCVLVLSASFVFTTGNDLKVGKEEREAHSDRGGLWFGPRLGKRSVHISEDNRDIYLRLIEAADALKFYYNQLPDSYLERRNEPEIRAVTKKVIFTPKLGRSLEDQRNYVDFTPRLGRRLTEELGVTPSLDQDVSDGDRFGARSRYFSPRLGRTMNFSPRLGRELYENYPEKIRLARSTNDTKPNKR